MSSAAACGSSAETSRGVGISLSAEVPVPSAFPAVVAGVFSIMIPCNACCQSRVNYVTEKS
ncbi:hypothetical protein JCGZ_13472 [Jatropha curcas]|uniref:Uncharacterized protein n=1 Tax=Jatropha curcas TaxID=180498 RepID=A0A067LC09_JATCU|nr:hypothetical protein JCGZ_13472 [Jatropha curcas]